MYIIYNILFFVCNSKETTRLKRNRSLETGQKVSGIKIVVARRRVFNETVRSPLIMGIWTSYLLTGGKSGRYTWEANRVDDSPCGICSRPASTVSAAISTPTRATAPCHSLWTVAPCSASSCARLWPRRFSSCGVGSPKYGFRLCI